MSDRPFIVIQGGVQPAAVSPEASSAVRPDVAAHVIDWLFSPAQESPAALSTHLLIGRIRSLLVLVNELQEGMATTLASDVAADIGTMDLLEKCLLQQRDVFMRRFAELDG